MKYAALILLVALAVLLIAGPVDASFLSTVKKIVTVGGKVVSVIEKVAPIVGAVGEILA